MPDEFPAYRPEDPSSAELWDALELPPPSPVPIGFAGRVVSYCQERSQEQAFFVPSGWARLATAAALLLGLGLGLSLGGLDPSQGVTPPSSQHLAFEPPSSWAARASASHTMPSLAEIYWSNESLAGPRAGDQRAEPTPEARP